MDFKDGRGEKLAVGDLIVYPVRSGASLYMVEAEITVVYFDGIQVKRLREYPHGNVNLAQRKVKLTKTDRVTKINSTARVTLDEVTEWIKRSVKVV